MSEKSVAEKARVKPGVTYAVDHPAPGVVEALGLPGDAKAVAPGDADMILVFANTRAELEERMPAAVAALKPGAAVWLFFRKGSKGAGLDMNRDDVWALAEPMGLRPLGLMSVDDTWSVFRLRPGA